MALTGMANPLLDEAGGEAGAGGEIAAGVFEGRVRHSLNKVSGCLAGNHLGIIRACHPVCAGYLYAALP